MTLWIVDQPDHILLPELTLSVFLSGCMAPLFFPFNIIVNSPLVAISLASRDDAQLNTLLQELVNVRRFQT